jgi:DNA helicase II / ATP-dependent DNA helicase PcrA
MLNSEQIKAVEHIDGPLLILAWAWAGKTHTLTERVGHLVLDVGIPAGSILCVTFTNKAAREMRERIGKKLGIEMAQVNPYRSSGVPMVGTFHSMGVYFLRQFIDRLGYSKNFVILDEDDKVKLVKQILADRKVDDKELPAKQATAMISSAKNEGIDPAGMRRGAQSYIAATVAEVYAELEVRMRAMNALDFDDILLRVYDLVRLPEVLEHFHQKYQYIMVDEYQDTNEIQYQIVKLLAAGTRNIAVVGDDWQGIYSWRGANIKNILHFERDYPDALTVKLEQNYRSTKTVIEAANALIKNNREALEKTLWTENETGEKIIELEAGDEREECREIAKYIQDGIDSGGALTDWAILYRTNAQSRSIEEALINKGIAYRIYGGVKFYERKEIKDLLAYMRLLHNQSDAVSFARIINVPGRKIGEKSLETIMNLAAELRSDPITAVRHGLELRVFWVALSGALTGFIGTYDRMREVALVESVAGTLGKLIDQLRYIEYLDGEYGKDDSEVRQENLKEFQNLASRYDGLTQGEWLAVFLEDIALITDADREGKWDEVVSLMTVHLAKGLEFKNVIIAGAEDGLFPHSRTFLEPREMEEERRLMYVALTRAKKQLYITRARERYRFGTYSANPRSKFVKELPEHLIETRVIEPKYQFGWNNSSKSQFGEFDGPSYPVGTTSPIIAAAAARIARIDPSSITVGARIKHPQFGEGTIVGLREDIADIAFGGAHKWIKKLNIKIAPIEKV